jgi:DNA invertase Pin-like site-specific DNA recombinase
VTKRFAFYGRVSTEDQQDPEASRNWQITRARALIEQHGEIVEEFYDIGQSRSIPWKRRPQASALLSALKISDRGFDAVAIGEPQRAFYGNQYGLTFPVFVHYGVQLWVPEVGGAIDPESEAHDLVMSVFGGMSKGERNRIKIRVRSAMAAQAQIEGRFLGGRPPYGYQLVDAGPHPNPAKAADGKHLHRLGPDPTSAPIVQRIFAEFVAGRGLFAIAEALTRDRIPSPSAHDPGRNPHRDGRAWSKGAVRVILSNPRYTGRQVWNKQRKDDVLIDVEDVALGHTSKMRWNDKDAWVWSATVVHEPLIDTATFERTQLLLAGKGAGRTTRERHRTRHDYVFRGLLHCGLCGRRMQGQQSKQALYYRCRFPNEYAMANKIHHPRNIYIAERELLPPLDDWLAASFAPHRLTDTITALYEAQPDTQSHPDTTRRDRVIKECDQKLTRYRAALEAGTEPALVARWTAEVQAQRAQALAQAPSTTSHHRMSPAEIHTLITALGDIRAALTKADPNDKAEIYRQLGLSLDPWTGLIVDLRFDLLVL